MELAEDFNSTVVSTEFAKHGYACEAELLIQPGMGRYVVTLWLNEPDGRETEREVAWEPSEPDRQRLAVQWAFENPEAAVLDAIEIDKSRRSETN
jgi:hypothetical protein